MNRHQSNPFLAGWEEVEDLQSKQDENSKKINSPFSSQRSASIDKGRLYHRNMSSFEAASLQLEQQQRDADNIDNQSSDAIAKLTAEFQSEMDKNNDLDGIITANDTFDPFVTINDDDVSLPSPVGNNEEFNLNGDTNQSHDDVDYEQRDTRITALEASDSCGSAASSAQTQVERPNRHESIDDDDDEFISTPVRNIKSVTIDTRDHSKQISSSNFIENYNDEIKSRPNEEQVPTKDQEVSSNIEQDHDTLSKASLFASLLASAECSSNKMDDPENSDLWNDMNLGVDSAVSSNKSPDVVHVISADADRSVSFFDPFETVIDKDALSSLVNSQQPQHSDEDQTFSSYDSTLHGDVKTSNTSANEFLSDESHIKAPKTTPVHVGASSICIGSSSNDVNCSSQTTNDDEKESAVDQNSTKTIDAHTDTKSIATVKSQTKRKVRNKKIEEDSEDSSSEDDRIQIVIKTRQKNVEGEPEQSNVIVPLLPPPPSKTAMKQARERGEPIPSFTTKKRKDSFLDSDSEPEDKESSNRLSKKNAEDDGKNHAPVNEVISNKRDDKEVNSDSEGSDGGVFVIRMNKDDLGQVDLDASPESPLFDADTSYTLEEFPQKYQGDGWDMMLRYPPKKKLTSTRFWKNIFVKLAEVPLAHDPRASKVVKGDDSEPGTCIALQIFDKSADKKPIQEIPIQPTYTVSDISSQQYDQFGKIFTIKIQYIFYKERLGVRQGQIARFIHTGHIGTSTTSGGHGADPISVGAIKHLGAPIEHAPQVSQIIKLGCHNYNDIRQFKTCLEDYLFGMSIGREKALTNYKIEDIQMSVRDETYIEVNQNGIATKQLARVRLFFLSFLNGNPTVEVGINDIKREGKEVVGRMDILPVETEEWIRIEGPELHSSVDKETLENPELRLVRLTPPDATFFELMRFRVRPPKNRELPMQVSANMSVTRTKVLINVEVMVPGCTSRKHGPIPCEGIAIRVHIPECWIYFFREEKHFRMGSKKSVNRRLGKVKGIERFLGGGNQDINDDPSLIEVTSGQAKYEHFHHSIVWRAARWPKEGQSSYVKNTMKVRLPLTAFDKMPDSYYEYVHVEHSMPATTVSHTTIRSISVMPCEDERPPEKYVKYSAKYDYKVKMRLSVNVPTSTAPVTGTALADQSQSLSGLLTAKNLDGSQVGNSMAGESTLRREEDSDDSDSAEEADLK